MNKVVLCGLGILLLDVLLYSAQWAALVQLQCSSCAGLEGVWAFSALRWATLHLFASSLTDGKPRTVLLKFVVLLCLLLPTVESCRALLGAPSRPGVPGFSVLLQVQVTSVLACLVWELCFSAGGGKMKETSSKANSSQLLWRLLKYFQPDTLYIIAAFTFLLMAVICEAYIPLYQGKVIDMLKGQVDESSFCYSIGQLALVSFGSALFSGLRGGTFMFTLMRLNRRLKHLLFHSLLRQEVHFFQTTNSGSLSSRLHDDVDKMGRTVALNANAMVRSVVKTFLVLALMLNLSWELTVIALVEMPLTAVIQSKHIRLSNEMRKQIQDCHAENTGIALQSLELIRTVRSFKAESEEVRRYDKALEELRVIKTRKGIYSATFGVIYKLLKLGIRLLTLFQARSLISSGRLTVGSLVSFYLYQKPLSRGLSEILHSYGNTASTVRVIAAVFGYLDRTPQCKTTGELAPDRLEGKVVFQNVTFTYPSKEKAALKSVSFEVQPGKLTALVGPSGSGKTSCVSLLKRLHEAEEGQIFLDGEPLHHYNIKYLQQKVASVSQSPELFCGSLRYNIEYGLKGCTLDEVKAAARAANADAFISKLDDGYDTDLGDCRDKLSNGEQHSIGIVRALVRRPQILVLDETTGKVDAEVWQAVLREVLSRGGTVLVVAHRLKTVEMAARIIFLENGEVMEEGTHTELLAKRGRYYHFYQSYD